MERLLLDACLVINLWAAGILRELASACGVELLVTEYVAGEAMFVEGEAPDAPRVAIDWNELHGDGLVAAVMPAGENELTAFLGFIPRLGDGEAASLAVATSRGLVVATDDAVALAMAAEHEPPIATVTTPDVVSWWADAAEADDARVAEVIARIEDRARFRPAACHPLSGWWRAAGERR